MLHDPDAFAHLARKMRQPQPTADPVDLPPLTEIVRRLEAAGGKAATPAHLPSPRT